VRIRVYFTDSERSESDKLLSRTIRLRRKRHLTRTLDQERIFHCTKCQRFYDYDYGCDVGETPASKLWCNGCWWKHEGKRP